MSDLPPEVYVAYNAVTGDIRVAVLQVFAPQPREGELIGCPIGVRVEQVDPVRQRVDVSATFVGEGSGAPIIRIVDKPVAEIRAAVIPRIAIIKNLIAQELEATDRWQLPIPEDRPMTPELEAERIAFRTYRAELRAITGTEPVDLITRLPVRPGGGDAFGRLRNLIASFGEQTPRQ